VAGAVLGASDVGVGGIWRGDDAVAGGSDCSVGGATYIGRELVTISPGPWKSATHVIEARDAWSIRAHLNGRGHIQLRHCSAQSVLADSSPPEQHPADRPDLEVEFLRLHGQGTHLVDEILDDTA